MSLAVFESMNQNTWSPAFPAMSAPMFTLTPAEVVSAPQHLPLNVSGPVPAETSAPVESEKELDFFAALLMDFSKGVYSPAFAQDFASGKRKSFEGEFSLKKTKRMPRSPSINALAGEQTIACEEHSSKHVRCPLNCPNRRPGSKRVRTVVTEENKLPTFVPEKEEQAVEVVLPASPLNIETIQPAFQPLTKTYELAQPNTPEEFMQILKWALLQLSNVRGSLEEIFNVIRKNGWKELKFGTLREMLLLKKNFQKYLEISFEQVNVNGEVIFYSKEITPEFSVKDVKKSPMKSKAPMKEPSSPSSDLSPIDFSLGSSLDDDMLDDSEDSDKKKKGRRWLRFACEKHRREHTKCSENCPHRKITYTIRSDVNLC